jgi:polyhydroxyalkanoate synthase
MADKADSVRDKASQLSEGVVQSVLRMQEANLAAIARGTSVLFNAATRLMGNQPEPVLPVDRRFEDEIWHDNPTYNFLSQAYLVSTQWMMDMADSLEPVGDRLHQQARFWAGQTADALSPTNNLWTNPEVLQETFRSGGTNLVKGAKNWLEDLQKGRLTMVPEDAFTVGQDLAVTPGQVIYRNELIELIQYTPTTKRVAEVPILVVPPWINKYYVMDMRPDNSLYKHLVDSGYTLFGISWKNPDPSGLNLTWDDYMELGPLAALEVVQAITGVENVNMVGYCLGGIMLQTTLAYMVAIGDERANSATFFATHQDFTDVGDIVVFLSEPWVQVVEWIMDAAGGYLDGRNMAATFNMLRANDLLWPYVINNYLMGKDPAAFDLLFWNSDATRVPGKVHSFLLREFFLENKIVEPGGLHLKGVDIDLGLITTPSYNVAASTDHIVPWKGAFLMPTLVDGPVRLILSRGGHIAGVISPASKKSRYWTNEGVDDDPDAWVAGATEHEGSWWDDWTAWLAERSGEQVEPPGLGNEEYPALAAAPGSYVLE